MKKNVDSPAAAGGTALLQQGAGNALFLGNRQRAFGSLPEGRRQGGIEPKPAVLKKLSRVNGKF